jgi:predicted nucleotidyltransferase
MSLEYFRATINSDVDILVEFERSIGRDFFDLQDFLELKTRDKSGSGDPPLH